MQLPGNTTLIIAYPNALLLIPAGVLFLYLFGSRQSRQTYAFPSMRAYAKWKPSLRLRYARPVLRFLIIVFIVCGAIAASRPQFIPTGLQENVTANILLALDLSKSMSTKDIEVQNGSIERLEAVKQVVHQFVKERPLDRIALLIFGSEAFLRVPLTLDHQALLQAVDGLEVGLAGNRTAIGDAISQGIKRLQSLPARGRSLILVTDGLNTSGTILPMKAAAAARAAEVKVYTIGVGSPENRQAPAGIDERAPEFDELTLKQVAAMTGGIYSHAGSLEALSAMYAEIDTLERTAAMSWRPPVLTELYVPFAAAALVSLMMLLVAPHSLFRRLP